MEANISAVNDRLRLPQVTCGNFCEAFIVCVRADFLKIMDASFYPAPNILTEVTTWWFWSPTLQIWFCSKKLGLFIVGSSIRYPKIHSNGKLFTVAKMIGNWLLSVLTSLQFLSERIMSSKSKIWSWIALETQIRCNTTEFLKIIEL